MGCAIIICAIDAINKKMLGSNPENEPHGLISEQPQIHHNILKPLLEYSKQKKGFYRDEKLDSKLLKFNSSCSKETVGLIYPTVNFLTSVGIATLGISYDSNKFVYTPVLASFSLIIDLLSVIGSVSQNKNFKISPAKFLRNEAMLLASTGLAYSIYNQCSSIKNPEDKKIDSLVHGYFINKALNLVFNLLLLNKNPISLAYEKFDKKISDFSEENYLCFERFLSSLSTGLTSSSSIDKPSMEIKQPTLEQIEIFSKIVSSLKKDQELSPIPIPSGASLGELSSRGRSLD
jgi:hypothetical protein